MSRSSCGHARTTYAIALIPTGDFLVHAHEWTQLPVSELLGLMSGSSDVSWGGSSEFDELLEEARLTYRMRDERGVYSDIWASGIMRRAVLAAGRRVANRGQIRMPEHLLEATCDEMSALVTKTGGPSADELAKRAEFRDTHSSKDVPAFLGDPKPPMPDLSALPPAAARVMRAFMITINGGTFEERVPQELIHQLCVSDDKLVALGELALLCEKVYGPRRDIEWAIQDDKLYLLQCRAITTEKNISKPPVMTPPKDTVAMLQRVSIFEGMNRQQVTQIERLLKIRTFAKDETIILEGSGGSAFYLIQSGEVVVTHKGNLVTTLGPTEFFGELSLIDGKPRFASVTAKTDVVCYGLTYWEFRPLIDKNPVLAWKILEALTSRLRAATEKSYSTK